MKHIAEGIVNGSISSTVLMRDWQHAFDSFLPLIEVFINTDLDLDTQIIWEYDCMAIQGVLSSERTLVFDTMNVLSPCQSILLKLEIEKLLNTKDK